VFLFNKRPFYTTDIVAPSNVAAPLGHENRLRAPVGIDYLHPADLGPALHLYLQPSDFLPHSFPAIMVQLRSDAAALEYILAILLEQPLPLESSIPLFRACFLEAGVCIATDFVSLAPSAYGAVAFSPTHDGVDKTSCLNIIQIKKLSSLMAWFSLDELLCQTYLQEMEDGQQMRARVSRKILDTDAADHQEIKFLIEVGEGAFC
jgi:hypothetical protein